MLIKKICIENFRQFKDKQEIEFAVNENNNINESIINENNENNDINENRTDKDI